MEQNKLLKWTFGVILCCAVGCSTVTHDSYAADLHAIAYLGTVAALVQNPEFRPELEKTRDALRLIMPEDPTFNDVLAALSYLPLNELRSKEGQLYVGTSHILLYKVGPLVDIGKIKDLRPTVLAIYAGISEGLIEDSQIKIPQ